MLDSTSATAVAVTLLLLFVYGGSMLFHSLRVDMHEYYRYVKYDKAVHSARIAAVRLTLTLVRIAAECYNLYQIVTLCSHTEYTKRHFYEMKHPGGHEQEVWRIMVTWWALSLLDLASQTILHVYATSREEFPPVPERLTVMVFVIESTITVFILNCPDANIRIGTKTLASIVMCSLQLFVRPSSGPARIWVLVGRTLVFVVGVGLSGAIVFMTVIQQVVLEARTGAPVVREQGDEARLQYAYFQLVFILQLVSWCTNNNKEETQQPLNKTD